MSHHSELWKCLPWRKLRKDLFRLQVRLFKAVREGDTKRTRSLQKLILKSRSARLLAIRQVTQLNAGKKTAGVDGKASLNHKERLVLEELLLQVNHWKHSKLREIPIPKKDGTKRILKVPTIKDRAWQCLVKYALEPAHEATFHSRSYGFRPGRSAYDCQKKIFHSLRSNSNGIDKQIVEIDIQKCFDRIDQADLMKRVIAPQSIKQCLWVCLKTGVNPEFPNQGTQQGGVISPLLANIALHGLENVGHQVRYKVIRGGREIDAINGLRYADDVVFILKPKDDVKALREAIDQFLAIRGLKVKEAKTKLVQSTEGFDFLGWTFAVRPNNKIISTPSQKSEKAIKAKVKEVMKDSRFTLEQRISKCGSVIRGWKNYHKYCDMDGHNLWSISHWTWKFIRKQGRYDRRQTNKVIERAFPKVKWKVNSFVKVRGDKSPFDGDMIYWSKRENANYYGKTVELLSRQKHTCTHCKLKVYPGDKVEIHHQDGNHSNWRSKNIEALHRECHQYQTIHGEVRVRKASNPLKGHQAC